MTEFFQVLEERRSIRKYEDREVPQALVDRVLEAVKWSPSWTNCQCWEVIVVRDARIKEKLQETIAPKNPATKAIVTAPVVLALCGRLGVSGYYNNQASTKFGDWYFFDLGIATQSLCLAARDLGLGTVIVGLLNHDRAKAVLNVPQGVELVALIPLGYPAKVPPAPKRREVAEFTHFETY
jgi:nitroreductase